MSIIIALKGSNEQYGGFMIKRKSLLLFLSAFSILIISSFMTGYNSFADVPTVKGYGTLTSIDDDGRVIIDEKGYRLDPSVVVIDRRGDNVSLRSISLPAAVRFEYIYAPAGFTIVIIEEVKSKNKRSPR